MFCHPIQYIPVAHIITWPHSHSGLPETTRVASLAASYIIIWPHSHCGLPDTCIAYLLHTSVHGHTATVVYLKLCVQLTCTACMDACSPVSTSFNSSDLATTTVRISCNTADFSLQYSASLETTLTLKGMVT